MKPRIKAKGKAARRPKNLELNTTGVYVHMHPNSEALWIGVRSGGVVYNVTPTTKEARVIGTRLLAWADWAEAREKK